MSRAVVVYCLLITVTAIFLCHPVSAQSSTPAYPLATTTVAILPIQDIQKSNGSDAGMRAKQLDTATNDLHTAFAERGFALASDASVTAALASKHITLSDPTAWTSATFATIGNAVHAQLVVLLVITDTHQGFRHGLLQLAPQREGEAKTKMWLLDVKTNTALLDGIAKSGKSRASSASAFLTNGIGEGSSAYVLKAIGDAITQSLGDFLKPYPKQK